MMANQHQRTQEAIDWLVRQQDPGFTDWASLTAWLEADPANSDEFSRLSAIEAEVVDRLSVSQSVRPATPQRANGQPGFARRHFAALAAVLVAALGLFLLPVYLKEPRSLYAVATSAGMHRAVVLAGGATVSLNGDTRLLLDRSNPRFARLLHGEASFDVIHDSSRQFVVEVGGAQLIDIGTRFNVLKTDDATTLEVAEGAVEYRSGGTIVEVNAGEQLSARGEELHLSKVDPATVGTWREGKLIFDAEPLAVVAQDISRNIGTPIEVDRNIAAMPVTAVVQLPADHSKLPAQLERLLGIKVRRAGKGWILTSAN